MPDTMKKEPTDGGGRGFTDACPLSFPSPCCFFPIQQLQQETHLSLKAFLSIFPNFPSHPILTGPSRPPRVAACSSVIPMSHAASSVLSVQCPNPTDRSTKASRRSQPQPSSTSVSVKEKKTVEEKRFKTKIEDQSRSN